MQDVAQRRERLARRMSSPSVGHSMVWGFGASAGTLVLQLLTGVVTARLLGPGGRGEIEAVMSWVNLASIVFAFGFGAGLSYLQARHDGPSSSLNGATLASVAVLGGVAVVVTEALIPVGFAKQTDELVDLARLAMFGIFLVMGTNFVRAQLAANNYFLASSVNTVGQPLVYAVGVVALWWSGAFTVQGATWMQITSYGATFALGAVQLHRVSGTSRPDRSEITGAATYGLRSYPASLSRLANARLDVVVMPAVLASEDIGLYVVAVSVGSMMVALFQQVNRVVFTNTVRADPQRRMRLVERLVRIVLYCASTMALVLAVVGPTLISFVYGSEFRASATPLRILLPGLVLWTCAIVLSGALSAIDRPGRTSLAQVLGVVVTIAGLAAMLPTLGIEGAALTSTLSYATVALANLAFLRRATDFSVRHACSPRLLVGDLAEMHTRIRQRRRRR